MSEPTGRHGRHEAAGATPAAGGAPANHGTAPPGPRSTARRGFIHRPINWLLVIPLIGTLVPEFYNRSDPAIGGMPFFYWYQLLWIAISVSITFVVYITTRGEK